MVNKFSKEYANKLAEENAIYGEWIGNYALGYMKAIEETAAPDLLEALVSLRKWAISKGISIDGKLIINADNAINKAHGK